MQPLALLARLAVAVPPPRRHTVGYHGFLSSAARLRPLVIPPPPVPTTPAPVMETGSAASEAHTLTPEKPAHPPTPGCKYRPLIELMARTWGEDLVACTQCGGRLRLVGLVKDQKSIDRFLRGIGESTDFPPLAPARGPPYFTPPSPRRVKAAAPFAPERLDESA
jgi:hypothetical protein